MRTESHGGNKAAGDGDGLKDPLWEIPPWGMEGPQPGRGSSNRGTGGLARPDSATEVYGQSLPSGSFSSFWDITPSLPRAPFRPLCRAESCRQVLVLPSNNWFPGSLESRQADEVPGTPLLTQSPQDAGIRVDLLSHSARRLQHLRASAPRLLTTPSSRVTPSDPILSGRSSSCSCRSLPKP